MAAAVSIIHRSSTGGSNRNHQIDLFMQQHSDELDKMIMVIIMMMNNNKAIMTILYFKLH